MAQQMIELSLKADALVGRDPRASIEFELRFGSVRNGGMRSGVKQDHFQRVKQYLRGPATEKYALIASTRQFTDLFYVVTPATTTPATTSGEKGRHHGGGNNSGGTGQDELRARRELSSGSNKDMDTDEPERPTVVVQRKRRRHHAPFRVLNCLYSMRATVSEERVEPLPPAVMGAQPSKTRTQTRDTFTCPSDGISIELSHVIDDAHVDSWEVEIEQLVSTTQRAAPDRLLAWATRIAMLLRAPVCDATVSRLQFLYPPPPAPPALPPTTTTITSTSTGLQKKVDDGILSALTTQTVPTFVDGTAALVSDILFVCCFEQPIDEPV